MPRRQPCSDRKCATLPTTSALLLAGSMRPSSIEIERVVQHAARHELRQPRSRPAVRAPARRSRPKPLATHALQVGNWPSSERKKPLRSLRQPAESQTPAWPAHRARRPLPVLRLVVGPRTPLTGPLPRALWTARRGALRPARASRRLSAPPPRATAPRRASIESRASTRFPDGSASKPRCGMAMVGHAGATRAVRQRASLRTDAGASSDLLWRGDRYCAAASTSSRRAAVGLAGRKCILSRTARHWTPPPADHAGERRPHKAAASAA